jgi:N-acetylmuramoyl-L-alanine amidase-like protein
LKRSPGLLRSAAVARFRIWLTIAFALSAFGPFMRAQETGEDTRKQQFVKARGAESPTPSPSPKPKAKKPKGKSSPSPTPKLAKKKISETEEATAKPNATAEESVSPKPKKSPGLSTKSKATKKKSAAKKEPTPKKKGTVKSTVAKRKEKPEPDKLPKATKASSAGSSAAPTERATTLPPRALAVPTPLPTIEPIEQEPAQLTIEKSGYEKPQGFFARLFGGGRSSSSGGNYRYLTRSIRAEIDRAPVMARRWQFIVVHNSGTRQGNAAAFDYYHKHVRRMQNGLAYHFVIGNGTSTGNGQIEVGNRWRRQINGGHVHSDYLNNIALGICLVGDFNRDQPTRAQLECCEELIRYLRQRCGKIDNHYAIVRPHREVNPPRWATDCPGDAFPYSWFRRFQD